MPRRVPPPEASRGIRLYDYMRATDPALPEIPVIVADEIARQIDALPDGLGSAPASAYGVVAPPFRHFVVEADTVLPEYGLVQRAAVVRDFSAEWREGGMARALRAAAPAGTHWLVIVMAYLRAPRVWGDRIYGYDGTLVLHLDDQGRLLDDTERMSVVPGPGGPPGAPLLPAEGIAEHAVYLLKALSAMHARCAADKVTPERQQRRAAERQGVPKLHEYYVLHVLPTRTPSTMADVGRPVRRSGEVREHVVRGHFRIYSEDRPMFGRIAGAVWVPEHERGSSDVGRIKKDYEVGDE